MLHIDYDDLRKEEKVPVRVEVFSTLIERGDWIDYQSLIDIFEEGKQKVKSKTHLLGDVSVFLLISDDYELFVEFWGKRLETDEEFSKRMEDLQHNKQNEKEKELKRLQHMANYLGYDLVKK